MCDYRDWPLPNYTYYCWSWGRWESKTRTPVYLNSFVLKISCDIFKGKFWWVAIERLTNMKNKAPEVEYTWFGDVTMGVHSREDIRHTIHTLDWYRPTDRLSFTNAYWHIVLHHCLLTTLSFPTACEMEIYMESWSYHAKKIWNFNWQKRCKMNVTSRRHKVVQVFLSSQDTLNVNLSYWFLFLLTLWIESCNFPNNIPVSTVPVTNFPKRQCLFHSCPTITNSNPFRHKV